MKTAIFGLGRSGLAVARGVLREGGTPIVFDSGSREKSSKPEVVRAAEELGVEIRWEFTGDLPGGFETLVTNPAVDYRHPMLQKAVADGVEVIGEVEFAYRIAKAPIVAITGTNGKSTTVTMTYRCLEAVGERPILCGNIFGSGLPETTLTEAALEADEDQTLVAEISSFQLEWVKAFRPAVAAITNITNDHLNRYEGQPDYAKTKLRIFDGQGDGDYAVVRAHDEMVRVPKGYPGVVRTVGAMGEDSSFDDRDLRILDRTLKIDGLPFQEVHNLANAGMAAICADSLQRWRAAKNPSSAAAARLGNALEEARKRTEEKRTVYERRNSLPTIALDPDIVRGLMRFSPLEHRMENLGSKHEVQVINNSMCTNPAAVVASVQSTKREVHILLGGTNKDLDFRPLKQFLAAGRHKVYVFGSDANSIDEMLGNRWPRYATMEDAFHAAEKEARPGQVIMLAPGCASTDQFHDFRERGEIFRELVKEWLATP